MVHNVETDFHSHVLAGIDDGVKRSIYSLEMIQAAKNAGVSCIYATPHCYLHRDNVNTFLDKRADALIRLKVKADESAPGSVNDSEILEVDIKLGAEVLLYPGIEHMDGIDKLCLGDTNMILLELPLETRSITEEYFQTAEALSEQFNVVMAHPNRYADYFVGQMLEIGATLQINAVDVCSMRERRRLEQWLSGGANIMLGSDAHRDADVYKQFAKARKKLNKMVDKLG